MLALTGDRLAEPEAMLLRTFLDEGLTAWERAMLISIDSTTSGRPRQRPSVDTLSATLLGPRLDL